MARPHLKPRNDAPQRKALKARFIQKTTGEISANLLKNWEGREKHMTAEERDVFLFGLVAMHYRRIVEGEIIPHLELREVTVVKNVV